MADPQYKLVDGELVELTAEEIAEFAKMWAETAGPQTKPEPELRPESTPEPEPQESPRARSRPKRK